MGVNSASASTGLSDSNVLSQETIDLVDQFIVFEDNKFAIEDVEVLINKIGEEEFARVNKEIDDRNEVLSELTREELNGMSVSGNYIEFSDQNVEGQSFSLMAAGGKNAVEVHWWGYKLFLNDNLTNTTAQALAAGAGGAGLVAIWAPWFTAPTAVVKAVAASVALVLGGSSAMFYKTNKGNGVYLRFTGILPATVVYTGMFAQ